MTVTQAPNTAPPQGQGRLVAPTVIHSWGDPDDCLQIEAAGPDLALLVRVLNDERIEYGTITWDAAAQTHLPRWNQAGLLAYPMRKRDAIDDEIYDGMGRWISEAWLRHQDAETRRMLTRRGEVG